MNSIVKQFQKTLLSVENGETYGRIPLGHEAADDCLKGGLLKGSLHEVFAEEGHGLAGLSFAALVALRAAEKKPLLWIRQDYAPLEEGEISASGLMSLGFDPKNLLVLCVKDATEGLRALGDALACTALGATVLALSGTPRILDLTATRRLSLAAAHKGVTAILARLDARPEASAAETRWRVRHAPSSLANEDWGFPRFEAALLRNRHGGLNRWIMEWDLEHERFRTERAAAHPRLVAAAPSDRSAYAYPPSFRRAAG
jgi:protein ImuA